MLIADDTRLGGAGSDPRKDFAAVTIMASSNVADKFNSAPVMSQQSQTVMPPGGFIGSPGGLPVQALPSPGGLLVQALPSADDLM